MYSFNVKTATREAVENLINEEHITVERMPYSDIPGTNPSWEIVYRFPDGKIKGTNNVVKDSERYKDKDVVAWRVENPMTDTIMNLVHKRGEDTVLIACIAAKGRLWRLYQAEKYLKKYSQWALLIAAMERYGYFN